MLSEQIVIVKLTAHRYSGEKYHDSLKNRINGDTSCLRKRSTLKKRPEGRFFLMSVPAVGHVRPDLCLCQHELGVLHLLRVLLGVRMLAEPVLDFGLFA